jgi:small subunit ribosomal protein S6e
MADFKIVLSDPQTGHSYKVDATGGSASAFIGKSIGEKMGGDVLGLAGYTIQITGASDKNGTPGRRDLPGNQRRRILLSKSVGFKPTYDGERRRKAIRGKEITADIVQINAKVSEYGEKSLKSIFEPEEPAPSEE